MWTGATVSTSAFLTTKHLLAQQDPDFQLRITCSVPACTDTPTLPRSCRKSARRVLGDRPLAEGSRQPARADWMNLARRSLSSLLRKRTSLGCITQYKLGPFGLQDEMRLAKRLGCRTMVTGGKGPKGLAGRRAEECGRGVHREDETASCGGGRNRSDDRDRESRQQFDRISGLAEMARGTAAIAKFGESRWHPIICRRIRSCSAI